MNTLLLAGGFGFPVSPLVAADGTQGVSYPGQTFTASGGTAPYTYSSSNLPPGLSINSSTGAVTGTPTVSGPYISRIQATDANGRRGGSSASFLVLPSFAFSNTLGTANDTVTVGYNGSTYKIPRPVPSTGASAWAPTFPAASYFVATTGSDSNNGTSVGTPFRTVGKAASVATAGQVVQIAAGTYTETAPITPANSGTSGSPIVFTNGGAVGSAVVTLSQACVESYYQANGVLPPVFRLYGTSYITVNGLTILGYRNRPWSIPNHGSDGFSASGVQAALFGGDATNNTVTNCTLLNHGHCGVKTEDHGSGICTALLMRGNVVISGGIGTTDHGVYASADTPTIDANVFLGIAGYTVHVYNGLENSGSPTAPIVTNNLGFLCGFGVGVGAAGGILLAGNSGTVGGTGAGNTMANHTGEGIFYFRAGCFSNLVNHNLCANNGVADCGVDQGGSSSNPANNADASNDYFPGGVASYINGQNGNTATSDTNEDPLFLNPYPGVGDYRPGANSSDLGKGCYPSPWTAGISMTPTSSSLSGTGGVAYSQTFTPSGTGWTAPVTFSVVGTLPSGLSLNTTTGVLSGTPTVSGSFQFGVVAVDSSATPKRVGNSYTLTLAPVVYINDGMSGTAGTMAGRTPDTTSNGNTWATYLNTAFDVNGSGAAVRHAAETELTAVDAAHSDGRVLVDFTFSGNPGFGNGLVFRLSDANNYWKIITNPGSSPTVYLQKIVAGVAQSASGSSAASMPAGTYTLEARFSGSSISIYVNGSLVIGPVTDNFNQTATKAGMICVSNAGITASWDNFKVTAYS